MKISNSEHTARPWRIHEIAHDFRLEDVWRFPGLGGPDDFPRVVDMIASYDPAKSASLPVRALFAVRWKLGGLLGWDDESHGVGRRVPTLRDRLPAELAAGPRGPEFGDTPFSSLYLTDNEWAAEAANHTMHGIIHLGWVHDAEAGGYRAHMAVYVKPNGLAGNAYMALIKPFRYLLVYPAIMREAGELWTREMVNRVQT